MIPSVATTRRATPAARGRRPSPASGRRPGAALLLSAAAILAAAGGARAQAESGSAVVPSDPETVVRRADRARVRGDTAAPIRIMEVSDFQCPYCRQYYERTFPAVDSLYVETGLVEYVWLAFPNPNHHRAWPAIEAAFCAGAAGQFWPMHDLLFTNQGEWSNADDPVSTFTRYARSLGVEASSFRACLVRDRPAGLVIRDYGAVSGGGVRGTPFFVVADSLSFQGAQPLRRFRQVIDSVLVNRGIDPPR